MLRLSGGRDGTFAPCGFGPRTEGVCRERLGVLLASGAAHRRYAGDARGGAAPRGVPHRDRRHDALPLSRGLQSPGTASLGFTPGTPSLGFRPLVLIVPSFSHDFPPFAPEKRMRSVFLDSSGWVMEIEDPHHPGPPLPPPPSPPHRERREKNNMVGFCSPSPGVVGWEGAGEGARG